MGSEPPAATAYVFEVMNLRVHFASPGFFLNDPRLVVSLADRKIYDGSFKSGFDVEVEVPPGAHIVETRILGVMGDARVQRIDLPLTAEGGYRDVPAVEAELSYSRVTGNFKRRASVSVKR